MPAPRKSSSLQALSGAHAHEPAKRRDDLVATGEIGPWRPSRSSDPAEVWDELVAQAPSGVLKAADRVALEMATMLVCELRAGGLSASRCTQLLAVLTKLHMTPASRLGMAIPDPKAKDDPAEKYFAR